MNIFKKLFTCRDTEIKTADIDRAVAEVKRKIGPAYNRISAENERLKKELAELRPWALAGALAHMDDDPNICACVELNGKFVILRPDKACALVERFEVTNG